MIDPVTAYQVVSMLEGVTVRGTAATTIGAQVPFPVAGKTGTTNDQRDAWFVGFTPDLVVGCFVGFDSPRNMGQGNSGGAMCGPVFSEFVNEAMADREVQREFRRPRDVVLVLINRETGCAARPGARGPEFIWEAFRSGEQPAEGECPPGGIAAQGGGFDAIDFRNSFEPAGSSAGDENGSETDDGAGLADDVERSLNGDGRPQQPSSGRRFDQFWHNLLTWSCSFATE